jgi:hypothetical protein
MKPQRIYLNVPFSEKDEVKKYGGQVDAINRKWYIMNDNKQSELLISRWGIGKKIIKVFIIPRYEKTPYPLLFKN